MTPPRPSIFDEAVRDNAAPANFEESSFAFLNRVAGPYWDHPRRLIEEWASHLPGDADYADIRARIRSGDDRQWNSAFLELYLHETLLRTGHAVTLHPRLASSARRPDFYAEKDGSGFFVEAVVPAWGESKNAARARRNRFFDVVNRMDSPNFILMIRSLDEGVSDPLAARLRRELRKWLAELDPDAVAGIDSAPRYRWVQGDWSAEFSAIPKKREARGKNDGDRRAIGIYAHEPARSVDDAGTILRALASKDGEYGDLSEPFVIAIGLFIHDRDHWHSMNAFYGHETIEWVEGSGETRASRGPDGYFGPPDEPMHTNVSSVLIVNQLQPYHVHKAEVTLWHHPNAATPTPPSLQTPGKVVEVRDGRVAIAPTDIDPTTLFGLSDQWPPGEPWPDQS